MKGIEKCRSCGGKNLSQVLSLGEQYVSDFVSDENNQGIRAPLELVLCDPGHGGCGLLQLNHSVSGEAMYRQYWYQSGINASMEKALADIAGKAQEFVNLNENDIVLDIGCNDGTLLRSYGHEGLRLVGFDPASNLVPLAEKGTTKIINDFFNARAFKKEFGTEKAKIVTSIAMFYDLDDPNSFVSDIREILDEKGIWVIQMSYLPEMIRQNAFDNICHEHLEYYSLSSLENLLKRHGMEVIDVETNDVNGGSFRIYVAHGKNAACLRQENSENNVNMMRESEKKSGIGSREFYDSFAERILEIKKRTVEFMKKEAEKGKKIWVYGASTKGNVLLQYYGLDNGIIAGAAERNPDKYGKMTVGTGIPIFSEEEARREKPDYFLILPWHFLEGFIEREKEFLKSGGKFIVPLPQAKVIGADEEILL